MRTGRTSSHGWEEGNLSGGDAAAGIHGGVGVAVSGGDDVVGEADGKAGGGDGVGCVGQVISLYPYVLPSLPRGFRIGTANQDHIPVTFTGLPVEADSSIARAIS